MPSPRTSSRPTRTSTRRAREPASTRIRRTARRLQIAVIDDHRAGRIGRRGFLRHAALLGMAAPLCSALATPARAREPAPGRRGDRGHAGAGRSDRSARPSPIPAASVCCPRRGEYLAVSDPALHLRPALAQAGGRTRTAASGRSRFAAACKFHDGRALTRSRCGGDHGPARRSRQRLDRLVGLCRHALERRRDGALDDDTVRVRARCAERQLSPTWYRPITTTPSSCRRITPAGSSAISTAPARSGSRNTSPRRVHPSCATSIIGARRRSPSECPVQLLRQHPGAGAGDAGRTARRAAARAGAGQSGAARRPSLRTSWR